MVVASRANAIAGTSTGTSRTTSLDWYVVVLYTLCAVLVGFSLQTFASVTLVIRYPTGTNSGQQFLAPRDQSQRDSLSVNMRRAGNSLLSAFYRVNHNGVVHEDESAEYEPETSEANENEFYQNDDLERRAASSRSFEFDTASDFAVRENSYLHEILFSEATIETNGAIGQSILSTNFTRSLAEDEGVDEDHQQHGTSTTRTPDVVDFQEDIVTAYSAESSHPFLENPVHIAAHFLLDHGDSPHLVNFALSYLNQLPDMVFNAFLLGVEEAGDEENTAAAKRPSTVVPVSPVTEKEENAEPVPQATSAALLSRRNTVAMRSGRESSVYNQEQSQPRPSNMTTTPALLESGALPAIEVAASGEQNLATVVPTTVADNEMDKSIADWIDEVVETKLFSAMERYGLTTKEVAVVTWRNATQAGRGFEQNQSSLVPFEAEQDDLDHESTATEIPSDSEAALQTAAHGDGPRTILDAFADQMAGKKGQHYNKYEKNKTASFSSSRDAASSDPPLISAAFTPFEKQLAARSDLYFNVPISHMAHAFVTGNNPFAQAAVTTTEKKKKSSCPARWCGNMFENYNGKKKKQDNKARGQEHHERVDHSFNIVPSSQNGWGVVVPTGASSYSHQSYYSDVAVPPVVSGRGEDAGDHVILNKKAKSMKPILLQASIQNREDSYRRLIEHVIFEQVGNWIPENLSMAADVLALSIRDLQAENATAASGAPFLHVGHDVAEGYNYKFWSVYIKTIHSPSPEEQQRKLLAQKEEEKKKFFGGKIRMRAPVEASSPRPQQRPSNYIESEARIAVPHSMFWRGLANSLSIMHRFAAHPTLLTCLSPKTAHFLTKIQHFATTWRKMAMVTSIAADAEGVVPDSPFNSRSGHYADLVLELVRAVQERRELSCGRICGTCIAQ